MTKSVYEFWISQGKDRLRLPVLPEQIDISDTIQNDSVKVARFGEITFIDNPGAKEISFSSFFPKKHSPLSEYKGFPSPENAIARIDKWLKSKKPVQFLITGTKINLTCSIEAFSHSEGQKDIGDRDFEIKLKEYRTASPRKIKQKKKTKKKRPSKSAPKTYTVKKGDTLWDLAGKFYGSSMQWRKIWNANKTAMIKRSRRNIRQPGHWIFPGQKLKIPQ
ncbi:MULTISPECIES: LysM peptidoglycan-binding domain-containing protein [Bacillus]|uniref:LysM peptidoglycan-binding domain-containing protein n=1 Tax=Bacillus TaxID=1386 RepID=UPI00083D7998|nr:MULTISPECIES: LysM peptidoglycan-binding domain-containing protein [Bacillus]SLC58367.1 putative mannose-specific lectin [Mycobacteroides abscessus subsp. massiliense]AWM42759.1 LysM peptidoglycan-binding domain-containing protein [Bacillus amyloliquefaciens]MCE4941354.1 LysM peptidoglycan-binding domain-containing protein [Bacillus velezensis]MDU0078156.1 LysM peptidoglycan-binding domain-containing protein [Bacillus sp. IG2]MDU0103866.1 LysM peptidoglycan-binding domain-containing protein